jgi:GTP-binding protein
MLKINSCEYLYSVFSAKDFKEEPYPQVAFAGRSNVGKSSLLNRLVGIKSIAKVSQTPGKTRAINFYKTDVNLLLVDLPGFGYAKVPKTMRKQWGYLIESYLTDNERLVGVVHLVDSRHPPTPLDIELNEWLISQGIACQIVLTKSDKLSKNQLAKSVSDAKQTLSFTADTSPLPFSAKTGTGRNELLAWLKTRIT